MHSASVLVSCKMSFPLKISKLEIDIMKELKNDEDHMWQDIVLEFVNSQKCHSLANLIEFKKSTLIEMARIRQALMGGPSTQERIAFKEAKRDMLMENDINKIKIAQQSIRRKNQSSILCQKKNLKCKRKAAKEIKVKKRHASSKGIVGQA